MNPAPRDVLILSRIPGVGNARLRALIARFGSAGAVAAAHAASLCAVEGIEEKTAASIRAFFRSGAAGDAARFADSQAERAARAAASLVTLWDPAYPPLLKNIYDPPPLLFVRGGLTAADEGAVAVVGTRRPSAYGIVMAERLAGSLAASGITVASGLARGIDAAAHASALRAGGRTLAVIGSGLDVMYPAEHRTLADRICAAGAVLSELPFGSAPDAANFPRRNRIVSGMTLATVVVETAPAGGAMITAAMALEEGREVFAVPSAVAPQRASGTNRLIRDGKAKLTECVEDILAEIAPRLSPRHIPAPGAPTLFEQPVLDALTGEPLHVDLVAARAHIAVPEALARLLALEFKGAVRQMPGKRFVRL